MADDEAHKKKHEDAENEHSAANEENETCQDDEDRSEELSARVDTSILPDNPGLLMPTLQEIDYSFPPEAEESSELAQPEADRDRVEAPWSGVIMIGPWHSEIPKPDKISHFASDLRRLTALKRAQHDLDDSRREEGVASTMTSDVIDSPIPPINDPLAKTTIESRRDIHPILKYPEEILVRLVVGGVEHQTPARRRLDQQVVHLMYSIANEIKTPCKLLRLRHRGKTLHDWIRLKNLSREENGELLLELVLLDPYYCPIPEFQLPDDDFMTARFVDVRIIDACCSQYVEVEPPRYPKRYLGGFRNTLTGTEYHHASVQTRHYPLKTNGPCQMDRDTQTFQQRNVYQQTANDMATQMTGVGVYVENITDKLIKPSFRYTTADEYLRNRLKHIIVIQKYMRRHLAKCEAARLRKMKQFLKAIQVQAKLDKEAEKERHSLQELGRRVNPQTKYDFDMIARDMERWRREKVSKIDAELTGSERKAALCSLLDEQCRLLECIGKKKMKAVHSNNKKSFDYFLKKSAAPKVWRNPDGLTISVDTPAILRGRYLKHLYESLIEKHPSEDERIDTLLTIKNTVKGDKCELTRELINLCNREAELVTRGYTFERLDGLRKRINHLFMQYMKTPSFNPACAPLIKVPPKSCGSTKNDKFHLCHRCKKLCLIREFQFDSSFAQLTTCYNCELLENWRSDGSIYNRMLKEMRVREDLYNDGARLAHIIQLKDINFLVQYIWNNQSVLSRRSDLQDLTLSRWDRNEQWSPWNCIVLTREEGAVHERITDLSKVYKVVFITEIRFRHLLARLYFNRLDSHEKAMPLTCDPDPAAWQAALAVTKSVPPAHLKLARCAKMTWPVIVKPNPRRPAYVPQCYLPKSTVEDCY